MYLLPPEPPPVCWFSIVRQLVSEELSLDQQSELIASTIERLVGEWGR